MESEFKSFENQWNEAFKDASVPPPDFVWENIEKELDKKNKKRIAFIWWKNPALLSGIAAALVLGLTVLFVNNSQTEKLSQVLNSKEPIVQMDKQNTGEKSRIQNKLQETSEDKNKSFDSPEKANLATLTITKKQKSTGGKLNLFGRNKKISSAAAGQGITQKNSQSSEIVNPAKPKVVENYLAVSELEKFEINQLKQKGVKYFANRFQPFRSHISVDFEDAIAETKTSKDKMWFGVNSGVAPFNPNFENTGFTGEALTSARNDAAFVSKGTEFEMSPSSQGNITSLLPNSLPESSFRNGRAVNFGFSFGKKLKKRLGLESGLRYMQASAYMSTNVYAINEKTGAVNSYFQSNYLDSKSSNTQTVLSVNATNKQVYNYFNVPVLLNYNIPLIKKLDIEALGGVSGDMFIFGNFDAQNSENNNLTAANSTFNLLNISGMGGLRLSYDISKSWEANLGSTYQQALISGVTSEQNLSFKPRTFGINYGVRFKMK
ncbi:hypothetical protein EGI26_01710 [Lacihabitans sp. CCS-44]|uniref:hypothetical protein n=1 Tax=Lacihabitans sp. CCS-44 TaxID=2487331 RepID=UPI0020CBD326|nr:hypothetical protein [Lacihabitans sp. CCS-44]MCP9753876.1 hypothetical protein [Lacihabitans sp. CCS-44]